MTIPRLAARSALRPPARAYGAEPAPRLDGLVPGRITPQACGCGGSKATGSCSCNGSSGAAPKEYVYMIGSIAASFPSLSVEKEFYQSLDPAPPRVDIPLMFNVLGRSENLYVAREMCWTVEKDGLAVYVLVPRTENELVGMIRAIAPREDIDFDVIVGVVGPTAPADMCNNLELPTVICDEAFDFTDRAYIDAIMAALDTTDREGVSSVFFSVMQMADNTGNTDAFRAVNFLVVRYLQVYTLTYELLKKPPPQHVDPQGFALTSVSVQPSPVQGNQKVMDVIFSYRGQSTNVGVQYFCRVDVSGEFPYLLLPLVEYYRHP